MENAASNQTGIPSVNVLVDQDKPIIMDVPTSAVDVPSVVHSADSVELLQKRVQELEESLSHAVMFDRDLQVSPYIDRPPVRNVRDLYHRACSGDGVTIDSWLETWMKYTEQNIKTYDLEKLSAMNEFGKSALKPTIIAGSGPSLRKNVDVLKEEKGDMMLVSCLHNFAFFEDRGVKVDYYVNLDSGPITLKEMSFGGKEKPEHYWEIAKERTLVTSLTGNPELHEKWGGELRFYAVMASQAEYVQRYKQLTNFKLIFSVGGNALGACMFFAKAVLGACPIVFIGADFSFGYDKKFHSWDDPEYQFSGVVPVTDIYGNRVGSYPSYYNFKSFFDFIACGGNGNQPGMYVNCTEGGILGAYPEGNIRQIQQMSLKEFFFAYNLHKRLPPIMEGEGYTYLY